MTPTTTFINPHSVFHKAERGVQGFRNRHPPSSATVLTFLTQFHIYCLQWGKPIQGIKFLSHTSQVQPWHESVCVTNFLKDTFSTTVAEQELPEWAVRIPLQEQDAQEIVISGERWQELHERVLRTREQPARIFTTAKSWRQSPPNQTAALFSVPVLHIQ